MVLFILEELQLPQLGKLKINYFNFLLVLDLLDISFSPHVLAHLLVVKVSFFHIHLELLQLIQLATYGFLQNQLMEDGLA